MKKAGWIIVGLVVILVIIVVGLSRKQNGTAKPPIKIGAVLSLSGVAASYGENAQKGLLLAADELNGKGGIDGRLVQLTVEDDRSDPKTAVTAYDKLVHVDGVSAVVGSLWDFTTQPLLPLAEQNKVTLITPSNLRIPGSFELKDNSFAMLIDFSEVVRTLKDYLVKAPYKKLAIVRFKSDFGKEIALTLDHVSRELGHDPIVDETYGQIGGNDFRTTVTKLKLQGIDAVYLDMANSDMVNFLTRARELGWKPTVMTEPTFFEGLGNADVDQTLFEGVIVLNWEVRSPAFTTLFQTKYGKLPDHMADKSYDALYVLADAVAKTGSPAEVAPYVAANTFQTVNGTISFTANHTAKDIPVSVDIVKSGKLETIFSERRTSAASSTPSR